MKKANTIFLLFILTAIFISTTNIHAQNMEFSKASLGLQNLLNVVISERKLQFSDNYIPSDSLIKKYNLDKIEDYYYIKLSIRFTSPLSFKALAKYGVEIISFAGLDLDVNMPIIEIINILSLPEIKMIEILPSE